MRWPPTRSGTVILRELTDQEALDLQPGEILIFQTPSGLAPLVVKEVKLGVAGDVGAAYEVPVVVGTVPGRKTMSYGIPDCLTLEYV